jgi:hypothetical protein
VPADIHTFHVAHFSCQQAANLALDLAIMSKPSPSMKSYLSMLDITFRYAAPGAPVGRPVLAPITEGYAGNRNYHLYIRLLSILG